MAAYNISVQDIKNGALRRAGELQNGTSQYETTAVDYINRAYLQLLSGANDFKLDLSKPFSWAKEPTKGNFILQPPYTLATVTATNGSTAITFSVIPVDQNAAQISLAGYWLKISNTTDWFRISAHTLGSTAGTLDAKFTGTTVVGASINAVPLEYTLSQSNGLLRLIAPFEIYGSQDMQGDQEGKIYFTEEVALLREYPMFRLESGTPTRYTIINKSAAGAFIIRINKYPATQMKVEYDWIKIPTALIDDPAVFTNIPLDHRHTLEYMAAFWLNVDKNDTRAQEYFGLSQAAIKAMIAADSVEKAQTSKNRGRLIPRGDIYNRGKRFITSGST